jgi:tRNA A-37 threonylcarbamoyl transferase component Bud32
MYRMRQGKEGHNVAESDTGPDPVLVGGRYRLLELAGSGAMATVHRARDEVLGRDVAVKTFRAHASDPRREERRRSEMQVLARLNHPSLVRLYDAGTDAQDDGTHHVAYLVMEFVHGSDLRKRLASGPLTHDDVRQLGLDLAGALACVHALGIVHRDIKPANILVPDPGPGRRRPAKLTDFGIARLTDASRLTVTNTTIGTANYLSPEQARGEKVGPASDIYSLGLVLLECLKGSMEFTGGAVEAAVARLLRSPKIPEELGEPWAPLLARMTAREAADRPTAAEVLGILRGELPAAGPGPVRGGATEVLLPAAPSSPTRLLPTGETRPTTARTPVVGQDASAAPRGGAPFTRPATPTTARTGGRTRTQGRTLKRAAVVVGIIAVLLVVVPLALRAAMLPSAPVQPAPASPAAPAPGGSVGPAATDPTLTSPGAATVPAPQPGKAKGKEKRPHQAPPQGSGG